VLGLEAGNKIESHDQDHACTSFSVVGQTLCFQSLPPFFVVLLIAWQKGVHQKEGASRPMTMRQSCMMSCLLSLLASHHPSYPFISSLVSHTLCKPSHITQRTSDPEGRGSLRFHAAIACFGWRLEKECSPAPSLPLSLLGCLPFTSKPQCSAHNGTHPHTACTHTHAGTFAVGGGPRLWAPATGRGRRPSKPLGPRTMHA